MLCYERLRALDSDRSIQRMSLDNRQTDVYIYVCVCCCVVRDKNTRGRHFTNPSSVRYPSTLLILFNTQQHERQREREKKREKERQTINHATSRWYHDNLFPFFLSFFLLFFHSFFFLLFFFSPYYRRC